MSQTPLHYRVLGITPLELANHWIPKGVTPVYAVLYADALKYLGRHPHKGNALSDLDKLIDCATRMRERIALGQEPVFSPCKGEYTGTGKAQTLEDCAICTDAEEICKEVCKSRLKESTICQTIGATEYVENWI